MCRVVKGLSKLVKDWGGGSCGGGGVGACGRCVKQRRMGKEALVASVEKKKSRASGGVEERKGKRGGTTEEKTPYA